MASGSSTIIEVWLEGEQTGGRITCPPGIQLSPGQYLVAARSNPGETLPAALFPQRIRPGELEVLPLPSEWSPGTHLNLRGPLGNGFQLPAHAARVAIAGLEGSAARLLPLAELALAQGAAVVIYTETVPANLPPEVEILALDLLPEVHAWADYLAVEVSFAGLPQLRQQLGLQPFQKPGCSVQVLIQTALPCTGLAECGICAVPVQRGWALVCADGPVFDWKQLEGG